MNTRSLLYLWRERTLFVGHLCQALSLSQGAATLTVSLGAPILVELPKLKVRFECTSVLLPPGCIVNVDSRNQLLANCYLDVMGQDYHSLAAHMQNAAQGVYHSIPDEELYARMMTEVYKSAIPSDKTKERVASYFKTFRQPCWRMDTRIKKVVEQIQGVIDENTSIEALSESVNLSVPGLTKLFKKQTGVPIRRYRQWHRLFVTAIEISQGRSLTDAAILAGFVDLSHCTHTFNMMLGMKPSYFLSRPDQIRLMTHAADLQETNQVIHC